PGNGTTPSTTGNSEIPDPGGGGTVSTRITRATRWGRASAAPHTTFPPPLCPTSTTGADEASICSVTVSTQSEMPTSADAVAGAPTPGSVSGTGWWPAASMAGSTSSHEEASSQSPGT